MQQPHKKRLRGVPGARVDKRNEIVEALKANPLLFDRDIAQMLGVPQTSVRYIRRNVLKMIRKPGGKFYGGGRKLIKKIVGMRQNLRPKDESWSDTDTKKISNFLNSIAAYGSERRIDLVTKAKEGDQDKLQELRDRFHCKFVDIEEYQKQCA